MLLKIALSFFWYPVGDSVLMQFYKYIFYILVLDT